jgi:uncharacterized protein YycO
MILEVGDIVLVKPSGLLARIISFLTKSDYSHTAIVFDPEEGLIMDTDWVATNLSLLKIYNQRGYDIFRLKEGLSENNKQKVKKWIIDNIGVPYDYLQLFSFTNRFVLGIKKIINLPDKYICSEMADRMYQSIGIDLVPEFSTGDVAPEDLRCSKLLTKIDN